MKNLYCHALLLIIGLSTISVADEDATPRIGNFHGTVFGVYVNDPPFADEIGVDYKKFLVYFKNLNDEFVTVCPDNTNMQQTGFLLEGPMTKRAIEMAGYLVSIAVAESDVVTKVKYECVSLTKDGVVNGAFAIIKRLEFDS